MDVPSLIASFKTTSDGPDPRRMSLKCKDYHTRPPRQDGSLHRSCCCDPCLYVRMGGEHIDSTFASTLLGPHSLSCCRCVPRAIFAIFTPTTTDPDDCCRGYSTLLHFSHTEGCELDIDLLPLIQDDGTGLETGTIALYRSCCAVYSGNIGNINLIIRVGRFLEDYEIEGDPGYCAWRFTAGTNAYDIQEYEVRFDDTCNSDCLTVPNISIGPFTAFYECSGSVTFESFTKSKLGFISLASDIITEVAGISPYTNQLTHEDQFVELCPSNCDADWRSTLLCVSVQTDDIIYEYEKIADINGLPAFEYFEYGEHYQLFWRISGDTPPKESWVIKDVNTDIELAWGGASYGPANQSIDINLTNGIVSLGEPPPKDGTAVRIKSTDTLPSGFSESTIYYTRCVSGNTCKLATTNSDTTIVIPSDVGIGNMMMYLDCPLGVWDFINPDLDTPNPYAVSDPFCVSNCNDPRFVCGACREVCVWVCISGNFGGGIVYRKATYFRRIVLNSNNLRTIEQGWLFGTPGDDNPDQRLYLVDGDNMCTLVPNFSSAGSISLSEGECGLTLYKVASNNLTGQWYSVHCGACSMWDFTCGSCRCVPDKICVLYTLDEVVTFLTLIWNGSYWGGVTGLSIHLIRGSVDPDEDDPEAKKDCLLVPYLDDTAVMFYQGKDEYDNPIYERGASIYDCEKESWLPHTDGGLLERTRTHCMNPAIDIMSGGVNGFLGQTGPFFSVEFLTDVYNCEQAPCQFACIHIPNRRCYDPPVLYGTLSAWHYINGPYSPIPKYWSIDFVLERVKPCTYIGRRVLQCPCPDGDPYGGVTEYWTAGVQSYAPGVVLGGVTVQFKHNCAHIGEPTVLDWGGGINYAFEEISCDPLVLDSNEEFGQLGIHCRNWLEGALSTVAYSRFIITE